jgi:hypothetical protein
MLWLLILMWVVGAAILVAAFAIALYGGRFGIATIGLVALGALVMVASAIVGGRQNDRVHGVRIEVAR